MQETLSERSKSSDITTDTSNHSVAEMFAMEAWSIPKPVPERTQVVAERTQVAERRNDTTEKVPDIKIENGNITGKVSDEFAEKTAKMINALPDDVKQQLRSKNVKIVAAPGFDVPAPQGALGVFNDKTNTVTISERAHLGKPDDVLSATAYHEVGHAIDGQALSESSDAEFQKALASDRKVLSIAMKRSLADYMSKDEDAYAESFAESFAYRQVERTGGKTPEQFLKLFQHTIAYMRKKYP